MRTVVETFEFVAAHLTTQGARAVARAPGDASNAARATCAYRAVDGKRCAVGCLIPDTEYMPVIENARIWHLFNPYGVGFFRALPLEQVRLLGALQEVHDSYLPETWGERLDLLRAQVAAGDFGDPSAVFRPFERTGRSNVR